jgi:hypothetical protein
MDLWKLERIGGGDGFGRFWKWEKGWGIGIGWGFGKGEVGRGMGWLFLAEFAGGKGWVTGRDLGGRVSAGNLQ